MVERASANMRTFAWQGFQVSHPEDWALTAVTGARREGYARLASPGKTALQIRWKAARVAGDLDAKLTPYLARLERDAHKLRLSFASDRKVEGEAVSYRWTGAGHGRGTLFYSEACGRIFFLEATGERGDGLLPVVRRFIDSFRSGVGAKSERWSALSMDLELPSGLKVERKLFLSGRTGLTLARRGLLIEADRWGFGAQLLTKHALPDWARAALKLPNAKVEEGSDRVTLTWRPRFRPPVRALVQYQRDRNQLVCVRATTRDKENEPNWDWIL